MTHFCGKYIIPVVQDLFLGSNKNSLKLILKFDRMLQLPFHNNIRINKYYMRNDNFDCEVNDEAKERIVRYAVMSLKANNIVHKLKHNCIWRYH